MRKILIAVPCMDQVPARFAYSLATLTSYGVEDAQISIWFNIGSLIYTSRDQIAAKAVIDEADLVMWFDSDMMFGPDTLKKLLKHIDDGHDIVTGIYYRRTPPFSPVAFKTMELNEEAGAFECTEFDKIPDEPFNMAACGFGCVLTRTEVLLSVMAKFGETFTPMANCGEDIAFCWRARQCGYEILADPTIPLGHVGSTVVTKGFFESYQNKEGRSE